MGHVTLQKYWLYIIKELNKRELGTYLPVQWLRFYLQMSGKSSIPNQRDEISHASQLKNQNIKE